MIKTKRLTTAHFYDIIRDEFSSRTKRNHNQKNIIRPTKNETYRNSMKMILTGTLMLCAEATTKMSDLPSHYS